jgi:hypothetical protein
MKDVEITRTFGISNQTLNLWKNQEVGERDWRWNIYLYLSKLEVEDIVNFANSKIGASFVKPIDQPKPSKLAIAKDLFSKSQE